MLSFRIICIGSLKERFFKDAANEYIKRIAAYAKLSIVELSEVKLPKNASEKDIALCVSKESESILSAIMPGEHIIALDVKGQAFSSTELSGYFDKCAVEGIGKFAFIIGGSNGYDDSVRKKSDKRISFSKMTFPHQLFRIMALEQIYRACKISSGETYHK